jgi:hypothetical protein
MGQIIYIPSINLSVEKERTCFERDWFECHSILQAEGSKMLTLFEFISFLKYAKEKHPAVYSEIVEIKTPWVAEWLDIRFHIIDGISMVSSNHILDSRGKLIPKNLSPLDEDTLMENKRISLEDYITINHTSQGLPNKKVKLGELCYWAPKTENNLTARFLTHIENAYLDCNLNPGGFLLGLGVRAARYK